MSEQIRILVIDNDPIFADTLKIGLQSKFGAEVVMAKDCVSARSILADSSFDLITLDYLLPDCTGVDFLKEIKPTLGLTQVVMMTGRGDENTAAQAYRAGAVGYIIKEREFSSNLLSFLKEVIDHIKMDKSLRESEVRYRRLFESASDGILILEADTGLIVDVNPFMEELLGYSSEEMVGQNLLETQPFADVPDIRALVTGLQLDGSFRRVSVRLMSGDGGRIDVELAGNAYIADSTRLIQCNVRKLPTPGKSSD